MSKSAGSLRQSRLKSAYGSASSMKDASPAEPEKASIRKIDEYVDLLYEDLPERIRGSALILQLARRPDNLEELQKNGSQFKCDTPIWILNNHSVLLQFQKLFWARCLAFCAKIGEKAWIYPQILFSLFSVSPLTRSFTMWSRNTRYVSKWTMFKVTFNWKNVYYLIQSSSVDEYL